MPAVATTVPAALTALVTLAGTALAGEGVIVFDGAPTIDPEPDEYLAVGFTRDEEEAAVDGTSSDEGNLTSSETYAVHCILSCATGDTDPAAVTARRIRCAALWSLFATALRADPTLGGVLTSGGSATLADFSWIYGPSASGGVYAEVEFDVAVTAGWLGMP